MRLARYCRCLLIAVAVNILVLIILSWWQQNIANTSANTKLELTTTAVPAPEPSLTIVYQDFDILNNVMKETVDGVARNFSDLDVLVVSRTLPYPPLNIAERRNIKLVALTSELKQTLNNSRPELNIRTNYVLFLPDGVSISYEFKKKLQQKLREKSIVEKPFVFVLPIKRSKYTCHGLTVDYKTWTVQIGDTIQVEDNDEIHRCGYVTGEHGLLFRTQDLYHLSDPFLVPSFISLYIQLSVINLEPEVLKTVLLQRFKSIKIDPHSTWQHKQTYQENLKMLYARLGVKRVIHAKGKIDWYGCSKETNRCFDTVYNDMPEYLYHGRWTPPCCLKALRETAQHVFSVLESCKVRYWLEGGSLLGAVRYKDIIPWDYDIDIGIYRDDMIKCPVLLQIKKEPFVNEEGFSWEKAVEGEGDFFRVQYSETNHLHVDIFPFYSKKGIMTKDTWIKGHKQDTEFPEHFLKPLTQIEFAGLKASAPNNVRKFLEYKFGKGVIESPRYPNQKQVF